MSQSDSSVFSIVSIGVGAADRSVKATVPAFDGFVPSRGGCMDVPHTCPRSS